ncbi:MAG: hypothetical protein ACI3ZK_01355 [Candidatus Cryptobacteroides sp.]
MKHSGDSSEQQMKAMASTSNILVAGTSSRIPVSYRFNKEKYNELKAKGFRLEF